MSGAVNGQRLKIELVLSNGTRVHTGAVHSADRGLLRVETNRLYDEGESVEVRIGGCWARGEIAYSVRRGNTYRTAIALVRRRGPNRRADRRLPVRWHAHVSVMGDVPCAFDAEVIDVSSSGFGLAAPREVRPSDWIAVETQECVGFGEVLHCLPEPDGTFRLGVRVVEVIGSTPVPAEGRLRWLRRLFKR